MIAHPRGLWFLLYHGFLDLMLRGQDVDRRPSAPPAGCVPPLSCGCLHPYNSFRYVEFEEGSERCATIKCSEKLDRAGHGQPSAKMAMDDDNEDVDADDDADDDDGQTFVHSTY